jgi:hypothetical protein
VLLRECVRDMVTGQLVAGGTISTTSATITMAQPLPSWVSVGMSVFDVSKNALLGSVLTAGGTTLTLSANALSAGSGSADILLISDPNVASINALITALQ